MDIFQPTPWVHFCVSFKFSPSLYLSPQTCKCLDILSPKYIWLNAVYLSICYFIVRKSAEKSDHSCLKLLTIILCHHLLPSQRSCWASQWNLRQKIIVKLISGLKTNYQEIYVQYALNDLHSHKRESGTNQSVLHINSTHSSFVKGQAFREVTKNCPTVCTCQQRRKSLFCLLSTVCINLCYLQWSSYLYWNQPFLQCSLTFPGKLKLHVCLKIWTSNVVMSRVDFPLPTYTVSICGTAAV